MPLPTSLRLPLAACAALAPMLLSTPAAAAPPRKATRSAPLGPAAKVNWNGQVAVTENGSHRVGNPDAPVRLVEYVSYTCSHCADFHKQSEPVLRTTAIPAGQLSVTVTNFLRNPIDVTVAMLTNCGDPRRFFVRHNAFFASQPTWLPKVLGANREQQARWYRGSWVERMRAVASDGGFYTKMETWGIDRAQVDACLADEPALDKLMAQQSEVEGLGLEGTPSFTLNGQLLPAHDWPSVSKAISAKIAEQRAGNI